MHSEIKDRDARRRRREKRVRKSVRGTAARPRLCVIKSNRHVCAQLIDDDQGITLVAAGTATKDFRGQGLNKKNKVNARQVGIKIAELAKEKSIAAIVFDRGHRKYHGILAELADGAREAGLKF